MYSSKYISAIIIFLSFPSLQTRLELPLYPHLPQASLDFYIPAAFLLVCFLLDFKLLEGRDGHVLPGSPSLAWHEEDMWARFVD